MATSNSQLPVPPRTPSPLTPVAEPEFTNPFNFNPNSLTPTSNNNNSNTNASAGGSYGNRRSSAASRRLSSTSNGYAPNAPSSGLRRQSLVYMEELDDEDGTATDGSVKGSETKAVPVKQPFNFKPMSLPKGPINTKPVRRLFVFFLAVLLFHRSFYPYLYITMEHSHGGWK
jgi:hypothetical protein